ncbi:GTA-gp10 family protein [Kordiimonas sp.]|uniref:GTA-gp10 family protein n=1 Tax=Kordiimonas sp. TaxID=1970157 RepID=UPI003A8CFC1E
MARKIAGETSLKVGARTVRLRLDIGTMMDLEDHFGMGLIPFLTHRLQEFRLCDMAALFLAMTGGDFTDGAARKRAGETLLKAGLAEAATAISRCIEATLAPQEPGKPKPRTKTES